MMKSYAIVLLSALAAAQKLEDADSRDAIELTVTDNGATVIIEDAWVGTLRITGDRLKGTMVNSLKAEISLPEVFYSNEILQAFLCIDTECTIWEFNVEFAHIFYCTKPEVGFLPLLKTGKRYTDQVGANCVKQSSYSVESGVGQINATAECSLERNKVCLISDADILGKKLMVFSEYTEIDEDHALSDVKDYESLIVTGLEEEIAARKIEIDAERPLSTAGLMYFPNPSADKSAPELQDAPEPEPESEVIEEPATKTPEPEDSTDGETESGAGAISDTNKINNDDSATAAFASVGAIAVAFSVLAF